MKPARAGFRAGPKRAPTKLSSHFIHMYILPRGLHSFKSGPETGASKNLLPVRSCTLWPCRACTSCPGTGSECTWRTRPARSPTRPSAARRTAASWWTATRASRSRWEPSPCSTRPSSSTNSRWSPTSTRVSEHDSSQRRATTVRYTIFFFFFLFVPFPVCTTQ